MRLNGWTAFLACLMCAATFVTAQEKPREPAAPPTVASAENGEGLMNLNCLSCHELRPIQMQALDKDGWTKTIQSMITKGAELKASDVPVLADYLAKEYGPVPEGTGKAILLNVCTQCHTLDRIKHHTATREEWDGTLGAMLNEGAPLSDEDYPIILNYLARNFKPASK